MQTSGVRGSLNKQARRKSLLRTHVPVRSDWSGGERTTQTHGGERTVHAFEIDERRRSVSTAVQPPTEREANRTIELSIRISCTMYASGRATIFPSDSVCDVDSILEHVDLPSNGHNLISLNQTA